MNDKQIAYTISILQQEAAERDKRIIALEKQVAQDAEIGIERGERLERMETAVLDLHDRVGKLEVGLRDVVCCLIDGKVDMAALMPGELHRHRILGAESVQAMVEVYHRLKE